ncbi:MAG TPA: HEAT repeat domain-containing protein [Bryobacteraceae bacterium]|nr:HEAT repeat domain-containing protein [Bryobacteraceae bacterium]
MVRAVGTQLGGARLKYSGMASDLRPYIRNGGKRIAVRRVAISIADLTNEASLQHDLAEVALDESEPHEVRAMAVFALGRIGDEIEKASLKRLLIDRSVNDPDDELKGGALIATWPDHLTAAELFLALTPLTTSISGLYQRFLYRGRESGFWLGFCRRTSFAGMSRSCRIVSIQAGRG